MLTRNTSSGNVISRIMLREQLCAINIMLSAVLSITLVSAVTFKSSDKIINIIMTKIIIIYKNRINK